MKKTLSLIASLFVSTTPFLASQAFAHGRITSSMPSANQSVISPRSIMLHFNERLEPKFSTVELVRPDRTKIALTITVTGGGLILNAPVATRLPAGVYTVNWRVVTKGDGHPANGTFNFTVR